jgi:hypothetical protein
MNIAQGSVPPLLPLLRVLQRRERCLHIERRQRLTIAFFLLFSFAWALLELLLFELLQYESCDSTYIDRGEVTLRLSLPSEKRYAYSTKCVCNIKSG